MPTYPKAEGVESVVFVDKRFRVTLGRERARYDAYFIRTDDDGTIVLTPAVVLPAKESK